MKTICIIGLGVIGGPIARHLLSAGYSIRVFNRTASKAELWAKQTGAPAECLYSSITDACRGADIVITCVGDDADLQEVYYQELGIINQLEPQQLFIDHSTTSAKVAQQIALAIAPASFIDAPVSGGQQGAEAGQLTVMCGGSDVAVTQAEPIMRHYAKQVRRIGPVGHGQMAKMVNQICITGLIQGLAEGLQFAQHAELDVQAVLDVIQQGAAQSWQMDHRAHSMLAGEYEHGFAVKWMCKDLRICLEQAARQQTSLPITALVHQFYQELLASGNGHLDTSSLLTRF